MEIREGWFAFICIVVALAAFQFGRVIAWQGVNWDCDKMQRFKFGETVYECKHIKTNVE